MDSGDNQKFGKWRSVLWPINNFELNKFLPMILLKFFIIFIYATVRNLKDTFVQEYAVLGGTELISSLKLWFVFPSAIIITMIFSFFVSKFEMKKIFYFVTGFFAIFFFIFAWFLFPNANKINMSNDTMTAMQSSWPNIFYYIIPCLGNWSYTLFFIVSEMWGTLEASLLFWYFANQITKKTEVKRFYALYSISDVGSYLSGFFIEKIAKTNSEIFNKNIKILLTIVSFFLFNSYIYLLLYQ